MTDDLVKRLRSPANVFYEYAADNGAFLLEAADRIEKLEAALRNVAVTLDSEEIPYMVRNRYAYATAKEALEAL
jgi:hypothetical protein